MARDWLGHMFMDMADGLWRPRPSAAGGALVPVFRLPNNGKRAILRARDDTYLQSFPRLDISCARLLHLDGHMGDAALHYAKAARASAAFWSRSTAAHCARALRNSWITSTWPSSPKKLCEQMSLSEARDARLSESRRAAGSARSPIGEKGMLWYDEDGRRARICRRCTCPLKRSSTPPAPATSSTAPIARPIWSGRERALARSFRIRPRGLGPQGAASRQ